MLMGVGTAQQPASTSTNDCEQERLEQSIMMMMNQFGWATGQACDTVMTAETEDGEIRITGDVSPGETVTITLTDGLADADVTVDGEPVAPTDVDGEIEVVVPDNGELIIVVESEHADHTISLAGNETSTEVSSSISSSTSSTTSSGSSTTVSTSTNTSTTSTTSTSTSSDST